MADPLEGPLKDFATRIIETLRQPANAALALAATYIALRLSPSLRHEVLATLQPHRQGLTQLLNFIITISIAYGTFMVSMLLISLLVELGRVTLVRITKDSALAVGLLYPDRSFSQKVGTHLVDAYFWGAYFIALGHVLSLPQAGAMFTQLRGPGSWHAALLAPAVPVLMFFLPSALIQEWPRTKDST